jgi:fructose-1,6-bisphosphatase/inositol monophosphatase family enzyme
MQSTPALEVNITCGVSLLFFFLASHRYLGIVGDGWHPWDYCAGSLILREAGGSLFTSGGGSFHLLASGVAGAATEDLARELVEAIVSVAPEIRET